MISPSVTISRFSLGISSPITDLPGMTSTTRTEMADSARARSLARPEIWLTLTPGAGCISKRVTTGPGCTATTSTSTPKSRSLISTSRDTFRWIVQQAHRGQLAGLRRIEHRDLPLLLGAFTALDRRRRLLDHRDHARRGLLFLLLLHCFLAYALAFLSVGHVTSRTPPGLQPREPMPEAMADGIHHADPRNVEGQRRTGHPGCKHQQR